jgi:calcineurin-like phosphoesterase family protein
MQPVLPRFENLLAKRVWFITDIHLGVKNNSNEWVEIIEAYFDNFFFPLVEENYQPGDVLLCLGDFFDSRQSVNLRVLNLGVKIAEKFSEIFVDGIWILIGNHDIFGKNTNDINSLKTIKWIPGITICEEPTSIKLGNRTFFMMPWRKNTEEEESCLDNIHPHDFLCCHCDIRGLKFNKFVNIEHGSDISKFQKFSKVFSGHIHYAQKVGNIHMLGSPYELTRSDMGNSKGIYLLDLETQQIEFFGNDFSPKFKRYSFDDILEKTPEEVNLEFSNNFVDVLIEPRMALKAPLNLLTESVENPRKIQFHPYDPNQATSLTEKLRDEESSNFEVMDFIREYVQNLEIPDDDKEKILKTISKLYSIVQQKDLEERL